MTRDQEALFAMHLKVRNFYVKNTAALAPVPAVVPFFLEVKAKINELILADAGGRSDVSGYAMAKAVLRQQLEMLAMKVSNALASYSVVNNDYVLQKKADFTTSSWYKFSEEELVTQAMVVKNLAVPLTTSLGAFGATGADVATLELSINSFTDAISDPSLAIDQRKNDNLRVAELLDQIRTVLSDKLDVLMRSFEVDSPALYDLYLSARAIDVNGSVMQPTVVSEVQPAALATVFSAPAYNANQFYTLQNLGTEAVFFSLSTVENTAGTDEVMLNAGETRTRLAENLSPSGTFLVVRNPSLLIVKVKVWVE
jgi:hypothetical protein